MGKLYLGGAGGAIGMSGRGQKHNLARHHQHIGELRTLPLRDEPLPLFTLLILNLHPDCEGGDACGVT